MRNSRCLAAILEAGLLAGLCSATFAQSTPAQPSTVASIQPVSEPASQTPPEPVPQPQAAGQQAAQSSATQPVSDPQSSEPPLADIASASGTNSPYHIGVDDIITISVWHEPDLSRNVPVRPDGKISLPLVGDVQAAGKTAMGLQAELKTSLAKFVKDPELTVIVSDIRSRRINVIGQVNRPGAYALTQSEGVLDAIAQASGLRDFAKTKDIYVLRETADGKRLRLHYDYQNVIKGKKGAQDIMLQPRDTVVVP
jgi:polysaccharide export outer membrane protein